MARWAARAHEARAAQTNARPFAAALAMDEAGKHPEVAEKADMRQRSEFRRQALIDSQRLLGGFVADTAHGEMAGTVDTVSGACQ